MDRIVKLYAIAEYQTSVRKVSKRISIICGISDCPRIVSYRICLVSDCEAPIVGQPPAAGRYYMNGAFSHDASRILLAISTSEGTLAAEKRK